MYQKRYLRDFTHITPPAKPEEVYRSSFECSSERYYPFGYYVLGGVDITGKALRTDGHVTFDTEDDLTLMSGSDATCDPRVGFLDIVEQVGYQAAAEMTESASAEQK